MIRGLWGATASAAPEEPPITGGCHESSGESRLDWRFLVLCGIALQPALAQDKIKIGVP